MDINLNTLKRDIEESLDASGLAVFRGVPGGFDDLSLVLWDTEQYPDYHLFLEAAKKAGAGLIVFGTRTFDEVELDDAFEQLKECDLERTERRELESRLREVRAHVGATCSLELAFGHQGTMYVYDLTPDWYEEFLGVHDEIMSHVPDDDEGGDSLDGYFSRN